MTMVTDQKQEGNTCTEKKTTGKDNGNEIKKHNRHQHNTDYGMQAIGEELIHDIQMSR